MLVPSFQKIYFVRVSVLSFVKALTVSDPRLFARDTATKNKKICGSSFQEEMPNTQ